MHMFSNNVTFHLIHCHKWFFIGMAFHISQVVDFRTTLICSWQMWAHYKFELQTLKAKCVETLPSLPYTVTCLDLSHVRLLHTDECFVYWNAYAKSVTAVLKVNEILANPKLAACRFLMTWGHFGVNAVFKEWLKRFIYILFCWVCSPFSLYLYSSPGFSL